MVFGFPIVLFNNYNKTAFFDKEYRSGTDKNNSKSPLYVLKVRLNHYKHVLFHPDQVELIKLVKKKGTRVKFYNSRMKISKTDPFSSQISSV